MKKTLNPSTKKKPSPKNTTDPNHVYSWRNMPISLGFVENLIEHVLAYPQNYPHEISITEAYLSKGISRATYYGLLKKHPKLKEAHEITLRRIGERLLRKSINKEANWNPVQFVLYTYAPEFKEATEYHAQLNKKEPETPSNIVVQIPPIPNSDLVERKKNDEE